MKGRTQTRFCTQAWLSSLFLSELAPAWPPPRVAAVLEETPHRDAVTWAGNFRRQNRTELTWLVRPAPRQFARHREIIGVSFDDVFPTQGCNPRFGFDHCSPLKKLHMLAVAVELIVWFQLPTQ
jgi:hypothetical protein